MSCSFFTCEIWHDIWNKKYINVTGKRTFSVHSKYHIGSYSRRILEFWTWPWSSIHDFLVSHLEDFTFFSKHPPILQILHLKIFFGCQVSDVSCRMSGVRCRMSDIRHLTSDTWHPTSDIRHLTSDTWHPTSDTWHPTPVNWHPTVDIRHLTSDT